MMPLSHDDQFELFDMSDEPARPRRLTLGVVQLHLRYDQVIIGGIAGLIGLTILFAMGVERGKQLVRGERMLLPPRESRVSGGMPAEPITAQEAPTPTVAPAPLPAQDDETLKVRQQEPAPKRSPKEKRRYAVQIVTYSRPQLAKRELQRLQKEGEQAFLVQRQGHTVLYIGPYSSKTKAREKLTTLKTRYSDCFVRSL